MIGTIRKHQNWLWAIIIAATIISFVYLLSPSTKNGGGGFDMPDVNLGSVFGEPVTRDQYQAAMQEAKIFYRLNSGQWPTGSDDKKNLENIIQQRLLLQAELDQYHINPTTESTARFIRQFIGIKPGDVVPADKIMETLDKIGAEGGLSREDFVRFARHQVGQEYLMSLVGLSGRLVTPQEAEVFFRRENTPMQTELVKFPAENYESAVTIGGTNLEDFYTKNEAAYRVPEKIQVNYIAFTTKDYMAAAEKTLGTNLNDRVDQAYMQEGAAAFKDETGAQMKPEAAKAKVKKELLDYAALSEAGKAAKAFLNDLAQGHGDDHPFTQDDIFKLAKARNLTVKTSAPFDQKTGPSDLDLAPKFVHVLFELRADDPDDKEHSELYAPLVGGTNAVYVIGLDKRIPSRVQTLAEVRSRVETDYKRAMALEMAKAAGKRFESALEAGLSSGKTFDTMCAAQFVHPQQLGAFSLSSTNVPGLTNRVDAGQVMEIASRMHAGQVSPFIPTQTGGFILYYKGDLPVDASLLRSDLPEYTTKMRDKLQIAAYSQWFNKEYQLHFVPPPNFKTGAGG
jgi:hypothetical protein